MNPFILLLKSEKLPIPETEFKFHPKRKWRFDYAWPKLKIAFEQEGGTWIAGRHNRGTGFIKDMEKYNNAVLLGWRVLRYTPQQLLANAIDDLRTLRPSNKHESEI